MRQLGNQIGHVPAARCRADVLPLAGITHFPVSRALLLLPETRLVSNVLISIMQGNFGTYGRTSPAARGSGRVGNFFLSSSLSLARSLARSAVILDARPFLSRVPLAQVASRTFALSDAAMIISIIIWAAKKVGNVIKMEPDRC